MAEALAATAPCLLIIGVLVLAMLGSIVITRGRE